MKLASVEPVLSLALFGLGEGLGLFLFGTYFFEASTDVPSSGPMPSVGDLSSKMRLLLFPLPLVKSRLPDPPKLAAVVSKGSIFDSGGDVAFKDTFSFPNTEKGSSWALASLIDFDGFVSPDDLNKFQNAETKLCLFK